MAQRLGLSSNKTGFGFAEVDLGGVRVETFDAI